MAFISRKHSLWRDGESTLPFVSTDACISREKRFKHFSIYWPEKAVSTQAVKKKGSEADELAHKISKLIDEEEKNQLRMNKVNGSLKKLMSKTAGFKNASPRETFSNFRPSTTAVLNSENQRIVHRLAVERGARQSKLRDRHGNRANLGENQEDEMLNRLREQHSLKGTETGFFTSRRIKLDLPHNYYPGPGTYDVKRYLEDKRERGASLGSR